MVIKVRKEYKTEPVEKVKFGVYLKKNLVEEFKELVAERYGKVERGLLSFEVEQALQSWISTHKNTQNKFYEKENPIPKVFWVREQVKKYLRGQFGYVEIYKIPLLHLRMALGAVRGTDERTIKKWLKLFERYKVIKWISPALVEFS